MTDGNHSHSNSYEDDLRAEAYARLEFPGTYYVAYRDIPDIIRTHVTGTRALDFGCGAGRSTRFVRELGFDSIGVDISDAMVRKAQSLDPSGDYRAIADGDFSQFAAGSFDLVTAIFTFDNIPLVERRVRLLQKLRELLKPSGKLLLLDSTPEIYTNEWVSFSTKMFAENPRAKSGDVVRTVILGVGDPRPVEDYFWTHQDYLHAFKSAGLELAGTYHPLATGDEPVEWVSETRVAPWVIYVLMSKP